jgi:hypothetical protein
MDLVSQFQLSEILMHHFVALVGSFHQILSSRSFLFVRRRKLALVQMKFRRSSLLLMFFMAKFAAFGIFGIQLNDFKQDLLHFPVKLLYSSFLGLESFNFDISALK